MKKLVLLKAASDFAFANIGTTDKLKLAEASLAAFSAGVFDSADLDVWQSSVSSSLRTWQMVQNQKLPSEVIASQPAQPPKPAAPVQSN